jgi:hypothetical protein
LFQQLPQVLLVGGAHLRLATGPARFVKSGLAPGLILLPPAAYGLIADLQSPADFAVVELLTE